MENNQFQYGDTSSSVFVFSIVMLVFSEGYMTSNQKHKNQQLTLSWSAAVRGRVSVRFNAISGHDAEVLGLRGNLITDQTPKEKEGSSNSLGFEEGDVFVSIYLVLLFFCCKVLVFLGVILLLHTCCYRVIHDGCIWAVLFMYVYSYVYLESPTYLYF